MLNSISLLLATIACVAISGAAQTQASPAPQAEIGDIVVTAQKRTQSIQDVPVSISVVDSATLQDARATDLKDIGAASTTGAIEPGVGVFLDGIVTANQFLFDNRNALFAYGAPFLQGAYSAYAVEPRGIGVEALFKF